MIAFHKSTNLKQLIGTNTIRNNQKFLTPTQTATQFEFLYRDTIIFEMKSKNYDFLESKKNIRSGVFRIKNLN